MLTGWGTMIKAEGEATPAVDAVLSKPPSHAGIDQPPPAPRPQRRLIPQTLPARLPPFGALSSPFLGCLTLTCLILMLISETIRRPERRQLTAAFHSSQSTD